MASADSCSEVFDRSEVCVETIVVVDTLGQPRRWTDGLCVSVRGEWKKETT